MAYKIKRNNGTGGFCCHFEHAGKRYYADVRHTFDHGSECMIFQEDVWDELYTKWNVPVTREGLISCIEEFVRGLEEEKR